MRAGSAGWVRGVAAVVLALLVAGRDAQAQRLPGGVTPEHYSLTITPDLKAATFSGFETIDVVLSQPSDQITLNALDLNFASVRGASMQSAQAAAWQEATVSKSYGEQQATLHFARAFAAGPVRLEIHYSGTINDRLRGFYLSKTKTHVYGVTQFEATDARRAFPSFDEPALKATFDVTLVIDQADTGISNTPIVSDKPGPVEGKHTVSFATTPKMSTYLVAWLIGDWACTQGKSEGVPIRVCSTPDKVTLTRFALDAAKWDLKYYDGYFGIKYPLKKMDLVAIPDFEAGAMENFGCLTFRETELLVDDKDGAVAAKKEVTTTVAHEISHQWFGDMVTMQWWDNLWLNEGFATWMESKAAERWRPEWKFDQDVATELDGTMQLDAQPGTRPIRAKVETPRQIDAAFDAIAYGKAGSVIGMVENWVGEDVFRKGVQAYLQGHLYGNATAEDFWSTQTRVSGLPVDHVMRSFVEQPGIPVITLGELAGGQIPVAQKRFVLKESGSGGDSGGLHGAPELNEAPQAPAQAAAERWTVPLCFLGAACRVVTPETHTVQLPAGSLLFADAADKGYYRTVYTKDERAALEEQVETKLSAPERIGLLSDRWALMRGGLGTVGQYLDLAMAVKTDPNAEVIDSALGKVEEIGKTIATEAQRDRLDAAVREEYGPVYAALGPAKKHESWDEDELRATLYEALGDAGDPAVLAEAQRVTDQLFAGKRPKDMSVADAAVSLTAKRGDAAMYDKMLAVARNATDPDLKTDALHLLTRFEEPILVIRTLEYAVSDEVKSQDSWSLIALELSQRGTQDLTWEYMQQHWTAISRKLTVNGGTRLVEATSGFCSRAKYDEVASFFGSHPIASEHTLDQALESIDSCAALRRQQGPELTRWLDARGVL